MRMKFLSGKPLHVRKRMAVIISGCVGILLILIMLYVYTHPHQPKHDPERGLMAIYTTIIDKIQSLFIRK
jgi:hypothetical protein